VWVYLDRDDRLGWAISFIRMRQSGEAIGSGGEAEWTDLSLSLEPSSDRASIEVTFDGMENGRQGWTRYFQDAGIASCEVIYEDFETDRAGAASKILDLVDPGPDRSTIKVAGSMRGREADQYSLSWCKRFLGAASSEI